MLDCSADTFEIEMSTSADQNPYFVGNKQFSFSMHKCNPFEIKIGGIISLHKFNPLETFFFSYENRLEERAH